MKRLGRALLAMIALLAAGAQCSLLVEQDLRELACAEEGVIGPPACNAAELCAVGRCRACSVREVCGDEIDNDCNGRVEDRCSDASGGAGGEGATPGRVSGGVTGVAGGGASES
jgi:hypothetical protein